jgi:hypothetical protein
MELVTAWDARRVASVIVLSSSMSVAAERAKNSRTTLGRPRGERRTFSSGRGQG